MATVAEEMMKLRKRVADAIATGAGDDAESFVNGILQELLNEAERNRLSCLERAEQFRRQAEKMEGQAMAFAAQGSIVFGIINGFVLAGERANRAAEARKTEQAEKEAELKALEESEEKAKASKKKKE